MPTIDLREFFLSNVGEDDYYWRFRPLVENANTVWNVFGGAVEVPNSEQRGFEVFDEEEAIEKFRFLCMPENEPSGSKDRCWFYLVSYYLRSRGYAIKEFPRVLDRPPSDPLEFVYGEIRQKAFADRLNEGNTVTYATRRQIVHDMIFVKSSPSLCVGEELGRRIQLVSTRGAAFDEMPIDEKLETLANLIENLLKVDGKFQDVDYCSVMMGFIDENAVKAYRKKLQCYRHSSDESIAERSEITGDQKDFLVDYGVTACKALAKMVRQ